MTHAKRWSRRLGVWLNSITITSATSGSMCSSGPNISPGGWQPTTTKLAVRQRVCGDCFTTALGTTPRRRTHADQVLCQPIQVDSHATGERGHRHFVVDGHFSRKQRQLLSLQRESHRHRANKATPRHAHARAKDVSNATQNAIHRPHTNNMRVSPTRTSASVMRRRGRFAFACGWNPDGAVRKLYPDCWRELYEALAANCMRRLARNVRALTPPSGSHTSESVPSGYTPPPPPQKKKKGNKSQAWHALAPPCASWHTHTHTHTHHNTHFSASSARFFSRFSRILANCARIFSNASSSLADVFGPVGSSVSRGVTNRFMNGASRRFESPPPVLSLPLANGKPEELLPAPPPP